MSCFSGEKLLGLRQTGDSYRARRPRLLAECRDPGRAWTYGLVDILLGRFVTVSPVAFPHRTAHEVRVNRQP
jgi:hypothetical protein